MEKQIKEMRNDVCVNCGYVMECQAKIYDERCGCMKAVDILYKEGYRKQSEGEWQVCSDEYEICASEFVCSNCKESFVSSELTDKEFLQMMKYCPNCGSKMKGGEVEDE